MIPTKNTINGLSAPSLLEDFLSLKNRNKEEIILGNPPSKSNRLIIITMWNKDKTDKHGSLAKSKQTKQYEKNFILQCRTYKNKNIEYPFLIELDVYFPTKRSDLDNSIKAVLDCLQQCNAIKNDNLCMRIIANKFFDKSNPRVEFTIKPI